jgi:O-antigen/teichoic acid export membrane protein
LARYLGVTALGVFILVRAFPEAVQQVLDCRTGETMVKYLGEFVTLDDRERAGALVRMIWLVDAAAGLAALAIVLATASLAARYIVHDSTVVWLISIYAVSQFFGTLDSASGSVLRVFDRFGVASVMSVCRAVARFIGVVTALALGGRIAALIYVLVAVEVSYTVAGSWVTVSLLRRCIGFKAWKPVGALRERRKEIVRFLLNTNITGTLKMSADKLIVIIIGALGGAPIAAQYKVAAQTGSSLMLFSDPFYQVIYPPLSKMVARREWQGVFSGLRKLQRTALFIVVPAAIVTSGLMIPLIPFVFGKGFSPAVIPAIMILWAMVPNVAFFWRRPLLLSLRESGRMMWYGGVLSAFELVVALALVKPLGVVGVAISVTATQWLYFALEIRLVRSWRVRLLGAQPAEQ